MCGICGIVDYTNSVSNGAATLLKMRDAMIHRGPDDSGIYTSKGGIFAGLGHRRLSIIDLSSAGNQPMANEDGSIQLVLNGEIYNYHELRERLKKNGHIFRSNTDTEVVVHLYEECGRECVDLLRGMFAFAVWNDKKRTLFMARDRAGKKPLFYQYSNGKLCFASELSALMRSGAVDKSINYQAMHYYLTFGYIPAPLTIYEDVFKLPPAHSLTLDDKKIDIQRYWALDFSKKVNISEEDAAGEVLKLLGDAVRVRMHSDVPLGAFLSGGIDSSVVVALMSKFSKKKVKTFSIGFEDGQYNELKYARLIAEKYGTEHNEFVVKPNAMDILPMLVEHYGEPYADSSSVPTYYVSRETKRSVTVALNGDGGDELFGGYERYQAMAFSQRYQLMPAVFKRMVSAAGHVLPDSINPKSRIRNLKRFLKVIDMPDIERYLRWISVFDNDAKDSIYSEDLKAKTRLADPSVFLSPQFNAPLDLNIVDRALMTDTSLYLPYDLLVKVDIASMANSLEARSPFLDHHMMEFAASLPAGYKVRGLVKKYILKKAITELVPRENVYRRKMGFGVPIGGWLRAEMKDFLREHLLSEKSLGRGYFKPEAVRCIVNQHIEGRADWAYKLWALLMLELWHKRFID